MVISENATLQMKTKLLLMLLLLSLGYCTFAQTKDLDFFLQAGINKNPQLADYRNQISANRFDSLRIRATLKPQINSNNSINYAPVFFGIGYDPAVSNTGTYSALVSASKEIVNKRNLVNQFEALELQNQTLNNTSVLTQQDLKRTITAQYITAYGDQAQLDFNQKVLELLQNEDTILRKLTERGVYRQTDYLAFLVTLQQQEQLISQVAIQFQNDLGNLNYTSGLRDTSAVKLADPTLLPPDLPDFQQSVFYRKFILDSLQLRNSDAQIDFSYQPHINLNADAGFNSSLVVDAYKNFGFSLGATLTVPIYDGNQRQLQHDKINIAEDTRQHYRNFYSDQFYQQRDQLWQQLASAQRLLDQTEKQLEYVQKLMEVNGKLMLTGDVRITDYIMAINNYLNTQNNITQNTINKYQIINQINYWNRSN